MVRNGHKDGHPSGMARSIGWSTYAMDEASFLGMKQEVRRIGICERYCGVITNGIRVTWPSSIVVDGRDPKTKKSKLQHNVEW